jgi:hypothetical protein
MFGAVYVFVRSGTTWAQQAYVKGSIVTQGFFGTSLALSADGSTMAVGAHMDTQPDSYGGVYVFTRTGTTWAQQAHLQSPILQPYAFFGWSVALSADGNTLATGAYDENSIGAVGSGQTFAGAVHVFTRTGTTWAHEAALKGAQTEAYDYVGMSIALSGDGNTLAFGAPGESGGSTGVNGDESSNAAEASGAIYVATRTGATWTQQAYIKPSRLLNHGGFAMAIALSSDGTTLAAGNMGETASAGAAYVFKRSGATWAEDARVVAPNWFDGDYFGASVDLTANGDTLVVGANGEDSGGANPADNGVNDAGAIYELVRSGSAWTTRRYIKASTTDVGDRFGTTVGISDDGTGLLVGAVNEASNAKGVGGDQTDNSAAYAGAAYAFTLAN